MVENLEVNVSLTAIEMPLYFFVARSDMSVTVGRTDHQDRIGLDWMNAVSSLMGFLNLIQIRLFTSVAVL